MTGRTSRRTPEQAFNAALNNYIPVPECGCWIWLGSHDKKTGYGTASIGGKTVGAHKLFLIDKLISQGKVLEALRLESAALKTRHKCDNRACVNPEHLETGTQRDNLNDMVNRGRAGWQK